MTTYDYETFREAHRCRCCREWLPVLSLAIGHEQRCAEDHGVILEPRSVNL